MTAAGALSGYRIVDASSYLTGPFATMMLGDLGASVVKVEPPRGDPLRRVGRQHNGYALSFANANRNKRSVVLDLRDPEGMREFHRLLADADGLVTNWRPSTTREIGLGDDLLERFPRLVWIRISGYGPTGPDTDSPAFDGVLQVRSGLAWVQGDGKDASLVRGWMADKLTSMFAAQALLAGLIARDRAGEGRIIDVPMLECMAYFNFPDLMVERTVVADTGPALNEHLSSYRPVATSDGWILVNPVAGRHIGAALTALGLSEYKAELIATKDKTKLARRFCELSESATRTNTTAYWLEALARNGVPAAPVLDLDQHLADPQVTESGLYQEVEHPVLGVIRAPRLPGAPGHPIEPAPELPEGR